MKYNFNINNVKFGEGTTQFSLENVKIEVEIDVNELKAGYDFIHGVIDRVQEVVKEVAPIFTEQKMKLNESEHAFSMKMEEQKHHDRMEVNEKLHHNKMEEIAAETEMHKARFQQR
jgi:hypothetical protein